MNDTLLGLDPAALQRRIQALTRELLALTTSKAAARSKPPIQASRRAHPFMSQRRGLRAHLAVSHQATLLPGAAVPGRPGRSQSPPDPDSAQRKAEPPSTLTLAPVV